MDRMRRAEEVISPPTASVAAPPYLRCLRGLTAVAAPSNSSGVDEQRERSWRAARPSSSTNNGQSVCWRALVFLP